MIMDIKIYGASPENIKEINCQEQHNITFAVLRNTAFPKPKQKQLDVYFGGNIECANSYLSIGGTTWLQSVPRLNELLAHKDLTSYLRCSTTGYPIAEGWFEIRTLDESALLARHLSKIATNPMHAELGLAEIFINAIEHGNLEIDFDTKAKLKAKRTWLEEITRRLETKPYNSRTVLVQFLRKSGTVIIRVQDEGSGFDWQNYLNHKPGTKAEHGRGLLLAKDLSFKTLEFEGCGNTVSCTLI